MKTETIHPLTGGYHPSIVDVIDSVNVRVPLSTLLGIRRALREVVHTYDRQGAHTLATDAEILADQITEIYEAIGGAVRA